VSDDGTASASGPDAQPAYGRVMLKLSGESLCLPGGHGVEVEAVNRTASVVASAARLGVEVAIVMGGGNIVRGAQISPLGINRATADYMGMLATVLNALALQEALERLGLDTRVQSALTISRACEPFIRRRCIRHLEKQRIVILAAGTGNPHVTTDSCAALRAAEINADVLLKATKVDGVFDSDPKTNPNAKFFGRIGYNQVINERLKVMDVSAIDVCQRHRVPIVVFNLFKPGTMRRVVLGEPIGTQVGEH
jgi:uridylate kinase